MQRFCEALPRIREGAMRALCKGEKRAANLTNGTRLLCRGKLNELRLRVVGAAGLPRCVYASMRLGDKCSHTVTILSFHLIS